MWLPPWGKPKSSALCPAHKNGVLRWVRIIPLPSPAFRKGKLPVQADCDIITFHTPLTTDGSYPTYHLANEQFLRNLKHQPLIINAARGGVVDEEALLKAMESGQVRQAIIDTWEYEPDIDLELLERAFIATPHIAGYSADGKANATRMSLDSLAQWMNRSDAFDIQPPMAEIERSGLHYSPLADSCWLKEHPEQFEDLRGNYPLRRE